MIEIPYSSDRFNADEPPGRQDQTCLGLLVIVMVEMN